MKSMIKWVFPNCIITSVNVYLASGEQKKVLEYRLKSLQIVRELNDKWETALTTFNIAEYYLVSKEPDKAYPYILESKDLAKELNNKGLLNDNIFFLSLYYELKKIIKGTKIPERLCKNNERAILRRS